MEFFAVFTWIDWVVVTVVSASIILSVVRGLVKEVASLAVWVVAVAQDLTQVQAQVVVQVNPVHKEQARVGNPVLTVQALLVEQGGKVA